MLLRLLTRHLFSHLTSSWLASSDRRVQGPSHAQVMFNSKHWGIKAMWRTGGSGHTADRGHKGLMLAEYSAVDRGFV